MIIALVYLAVLASVYGAYSLTRSRLDVFPEFAPPTAVVQTEAPGLSSEQVETLVLTGSGGPFRGRSREELEDVTPAQALAHPTWRMGPKITVDSATLANKGLEVIEAHFLFGLPYERIEVVVRNDADLDRAAAEAEGIGIGPAQVDTRDHQVVVPVSGGAAGLVEYLRRLDRADILVNDVGLRRPTLDDVFFTVTGHPMASDDAERGAGTEEAAA